MGNKMWHFDRCLQWGMSHGLPYNNLTIKVPLTLCTRPGTEQKAQIAQCLVWFPSLMASCSCWSRSQIQISDWSRHCWLCTIPRLHHFLLWGGGGGDFLWQKKKKNWLSQPCSRERKGLVPAVVSLPRCLLTSLINREPLWGNSAFAFFFWW